jgi:uncharacterized protein (DUF1697 family)
VRGVALLRAVNVGGANRLAMADLRAAMERSGLADVRTLLQSGNAVFSSSRRSTSADERAIRSSLREHCGIDTDVFVRTAAAWHAIIDGNPFTAESRTDPAHLLVMVFASAADRASATRLHASIAGRERVAIAGTHGYLVYPDGIARSKLTGTLLERTLATRGTARNWNTVLKLRELL